jgi:hypothetical protein
MTHPVGRCTPVSSESISAPGFLNHPYRPTAFPMHPVGDLGGLFLNDGTPVWAIDALGRGSAARAVQLAH